MIDPRTLTDEELAFLVYATERMEVRKKAKEYGFVPEFVAKAESIEKQLHTEYNTRAIRYQNFTK